MSRPTLGQRVVAAGIGALFVHVLENSPELRALAQAHAHEAPRPPRTQHVRLLEEKPRKRRAPQKRRPVETGDDVIDMEKKPDGTYEAKL